MKFYICLILFCGTVIYNCFAASLEVNQITKKGDWDLQTVPEQFQGQFSVGLCLEKDSVGDIYYLLRVKVPSMEISNDRQLVIKFEDGSILETKVLENSQSILRKRTLRAKYLHHWSGQSMTETAATLSILEDMGKAHKEIPFCNAYYLLTDQQIQDLISKKVIKCHIDTDGKLFKMKDEDNRFGRVVKVAYECIQRRIQEEKEKDIYKDL